MNQMEEYAEGWPINQIKGKREKNVTELKQN